MDIAPPPSNTVVDDRVRVGRSAIAGDGLFATDDIAAGTVVIRLAGRLVSSAELDRLIAASTVDSAAPYVDSITVYDDAHLVLPAGSIIHFGNHSCDPNLWHVGPYEIAARRPIRSGDELTVDYATGSGARGWSMSCTCHADGCRGEVSSDDWRRADLQRTYRGHWAPALQERIDQRSDRLGAPVGNNVGPSGAATTDQRAALEAHRASITAQLAELGRDFDGMVAANESANTDDEHDPEGATIAFERAQLSALLDHARGRLVEIGQALDRLTDGTYGACARCGQPIAPERLVARPSATTCIRCAGARG